MTQVGFFSMRGGSCCRVVLAGLLLAAALGCGKEAEQRRPVVRRVRPTRNEVPRVEPVRRPPEPPPIEVAQSTTAPAAKPSQDSELSKGSGLFYRNERVRRVPWSINLLQIERSHPDLELTTTLGGQGRALGLSTLTEQIEALPPEIGQPVAAINGDFYHTEHESNPGDPRGLQVVRGELVSAPSGKTCFWIDPDGDPHIDDVASRFQIVWPGGETTAFGLNEERRSNRAVLYTSAMGRSTRARGGHELILERHENEAWLPLRPGQTYTARVKEVRSGGNSRLSDEIMVLSIGPSLAARLPRVSAGDLLTISTATVPDLSGVPLALGGGPVLIKGGKQQRVYTNKASERHPRTAFGWNDEYFFLAEVDGRQHGFSIGMTLPELAAYLLEQGCQEAMNLDGGGSAEMWVGGRIVSSPCFGYERNTANALVLVRKDRAFGR